MSKNYWARRFEDSFSSNFGTDSSESERKPPSILEVKSLAPDAVIRTSRGSFSRNQGNGMKLIGARIHQHCRHGSVRDMQTYLSEQLKKAVVVSKQRIQEHFRMQGQLSSLSHDVPSRTVPRPWPGISFHDPGNCQIQKGFPRSFRLYGALDASQQI